MATVIQNLLEHALGDGARGAKFECALHIKDNSFFSDVVALNTLVKTSSLPGKTHEVNNLMYKGRSIPVRGQVKYQQTWECTLYLTEDHAAKTAFSIWLESIDFVNNYSDFDSFDANNIKKMKDTIRPDNQGYTSDLIITQQNFNLDSYPITYYMYNCFPIGISSVEVSSENVGQITEFTVTFAYTHLETIVDQTATSKSIVQDLLDQVESGIGGIIGQVKDTIGSAISDLTSSGISLLGDITSSVESEIINTPAKATKEGNEIYESPSDIGSQIGEQISKSFTQKYIDEQNNIQKIRIMKAIYGPNYGDV